MQAKLWRLQMLMQTPQPGFFRLGPALYHLQRSFALRQRSLLPQQCLP